MNSEQKPHQHSELRAHPEDYPELIQAALELESQGLFQWTPHQNHYVNLHLEQILDHSEPLQGIEDLVQLVHPDDRPRLRDYYFMATRLLGSSLPELEMRLWRPGHQEKWLALRLKGRRVQDAEGFVLMGTLKDIQARKILEEQQRLHLHFTHQVLESNQDGYLRCSLDGYILQANSAYCQMVGQECEDIVGQHLTELDMSLDQDYYDSLLHFGHDLHPLRLETRHRRRNGSALDVEISFTLFEHWGEGYIVAFVRDISERKHLERELKSSDHRLRLATEAARIGIWEYNLTRDRLYANDTMTGIYGFAIADHLEDYLEDLRQHLQPESAASLKYFVDSIQNQDPTFTTDLHLKMPSGQDLYLHLQGDRQSIGDEIVYVGSVVDQTLQKEAENSIRDSKTRLEDLVNKRTHTLEQILSELEAAREGEQEMRRLAEDANLAKSRFLANMSHEIRTPLNIVLGFAELMQQEGGLSESNDQRLRAISANGRHLLAMINRILELAKIESGQLELHPVSFDLQRLLEDVKMMFSDQIALRRNQLILELSEHLPNGIILDQTRLQEILVNLIGNSVKFTQNGQITLKVDSKKSGYLNFSVSDTGIGIPADRLDEIFTPFRQAHTGAQQAPGTGLGLSISSEYARLMGGELQVSSVPDQGSCFSFSLPYEAAPDLDERQDDEPALLAIESGRLLKLLIVDDRADNRQLLHELLAPLGFQLFEAENGQEAITLWQQESPDLILMDLAMPVLDGISATRMLRQEYGAQTPIIALTANAFEDTRSDALHAGVDDFIAKPFPRRELLRIIRLRLGLQTAPENPSASSTPVQNAELVLPSSQWREQFRETLRSLDPAAIEEHLLDVRDSHPVFYEKVRRWVEMFAFTEISNWLDQFDSDSPSE